MDKPPRVFISYCWNPPDQKDKVRLLADRLRSDEAGVNAWIDQYDSHQSRPWFDWMQDELRAADRVLMVFTPEYRERFEGRLPPEGAGKGVRFEGIAITSAIYGSAGNNSKFRVVLLGDTKPDCIPDWLRHSYTTYSPDNSASFEDLVRWIYGKPSVEPPPLGRRPAFLDRHATSPSVLATPPKATTPSTANLPIQYEERRLVLHRECQRIPIFGNLMPDIPMERNFINLHLIAASAQSDRDRGFTHAQQLDYFEAEDPHDRRPRDKDRTTRRERSLRLTAATLWQQYNKGAVLGLPGAGKTTILHHFAWMAFRQSDPPLVVFIRCRSLRERHLQLGIHAHDNPFRLAAAAFLFPSDEDTKDDHSSSPTPLNVWSDTEREAIVQLSNAMGRARQEGRLVLMVDAFDETPEKLRDRVRPWIASLAERIHHHKTNEEGELLPGANRLYLSARLQEMQVFTGLQAPIFQVSPLDAEQMRTFARHLYGETSTTFVRFDDQVWREPVLRKMGRTPLTALLLLCYFDVRGEFDTRFRTYDLIMKFVLLDIWEQIKRRTFSRDRDTVKGFFDRCARADFLGSEPTIAGKYAALAAACHGILYDNAESRASREFTRATLIDQFALHLTEVFRELPQEQAERQAESWLEDICKGNLLIATGQRTFIFMHSTLMEYLAAWHLNHCLRNDEGGDQAAEVLRSMAVVDASVLDCLPIACGESPEMNEVFFRLWETIYRRNQEEPIGVSDLLSVFRCTAEAEILERRLLDPMQIRARREAMRKRLLPSEAGRAWAYQELADLVRSADGDCVKTWVEVLRPGTLNDSVVASPFDGELPLSRAELLPALHFGAWWEGSHHSGLDPTQESLLQAMLEPEIVSTRITRVNNSKFVMHSTARMTMIGKAIFSVQGARTFDLPGDPEDKDFAAQQGICGPELAGVLGSPNFRHGEGVNAVACSSDGRLAATGGSDRVLRLWDLQSGRQIRAFRGHSGFVRACAISPDGQRLLSSSDDKTLRLWDMTSGQELRTFSGHSGYVRTCAFSPDGQHLLSGSDDKTLKLWDAASGKEIRTFCDHSSSIKTCAFSPDGQYLLTGSDDRTLKLWKTAIGNESGPIRKKFRPIHTFLGHSSSVMACAFSPDGQRLLSGSSDRTLKLWDAASGKELCVFRNHSDRVRACAFSPDGQHLLSGSDDKTLKLWDAASGKEIRDFSGHSDYVRACAFSQDGQCLISGSDDQTLRLWSTASGQELRTFNGHSGSVWACGFSSDGQRLLSSADDQTLKLWDAASGKEICTFSGHSGSVMTCAFSPDGQRLLSGSLDNTLKLWDAVSGMEIRTFRGHSDRVMACAFSPDGQRLVSGSADQTLRLWDATSGREIRVFRGHSGSVMTCAFSPDGQRLLSGSLDHALKLWDAASGKEIRVFRGHSDQVMSCAFSPDGQRLLSGATDKTLKLWEPASGREIRSFSGHSKWVTACAFSPDGQRLLSGSDDQTLKLWDAASGKCLRSWDLPFPAWCVCWRSAPADLWEERKHLVPTQAVAVGLSNGTVLMFDLTEV